MHAISINNKVILSISLLLLLICSITITIISQNNLYDNLSITSSILLSLGFISVLATIMLDVLASICNP